MNNFMKIENDVLVAMNVSEKMTKPKPVIVEKVAMEVVNLINFFVYFFYLEYCY